MSAYQAVAEPRADQTLGTVVTPDDTGTFYEIRGGASASPNLFHSFDEFSLDTGEEAIFIHSGDIDHIFSRVTGDLSSQIDGTISSRLDGAGSSSADIFLLNPNGIVFGPNALLDVGGSFFASNAEHIIFANGSEFSASDFQSTLLTVSHPIGLALGSNPGFIRNESTSDGGPPIGLQVPDGETIALIGNGVDIVDGALTANSGRIEIASLGPESTVELIAPGNSSEWRLDYSNSSNLTFRDVQILGGGSLINASSVPGSEDAVGSINISADNLQVTDATVWARNFGEGDGGEITINSGNLWVTDSARISTSALSEKTKGDAGNINISSDKVWITTSARIFARTSGGGDGGNIDIGSGGLWIDDAQISARTSSEGAAGNIHISSDSLQVADTLISARTSGAGAAGNIHISSDNLQVADATISARASGAGDAGNIDISSDDLQITGASISVITNNNGNAGSIHIDTETLRVESGGIIQAGTSGSGNGGLIRITAAESVEVIGDTDGTLSRISAAAGPNAIDAGTSGSVEISTGRLLILDNAAVFTSTSSSADSGSLTVNADEVILSGEGSDAPSGLFSRTRSAGDSGELTVNTDTLRIENGARLTVSAVHDNNIPGHEDILGTVSDANIAARVITLDDGEISATSPSGMGGDLNLTVEDLIQMRNGSLISASAGMPGDSGSGGNVTIDASDGFVVAQPNANNNILANAFGGGEGGNINITAIGIYGFSEPDAFSPDLANNDSNDISASSESGTDGIINLNALVVDPSEAFGDLEAEIINAEGLIATSCLAADIQDSEGRFVVTGSGGLPQAIEDVTVSIYATGDVQTLPDRANELNSEAADQVWQHGDPIIEPDSIVAMPDDRILLIGTAAQMCDRFKN